MVILFNDTIMMMRKLSESSILRITITVPYPNIMSFFVYSFMYVYRCDYYNGRLCCDELGVVYSMTRCNRMTFGVDADTHIDSLEQAESVTVEGTSKWSCKLIITGKH